MQRFSKPWLYIISAMWSYHGKGSGRPHQPFEVLDASVWESQPIRTANDNDAQGYVKSQLHQLDISHEIQELLDNSENDEKLRDLDNAYDLSQRMRSKIALLQQAKILQELAITRLREDIDRMEADQEELKALQAELKVNLQRAKTFIDTRAQLNETKKAAIDEFMREKNLTEFDLSKLLQKCQPDETSQRSQGSAMSANSDNK